MKIVIAPDSFKGSLTSTEAAKAIAEGVKAARPDAEVIVIPIADGGDGTIEALALATHNAKHVSTQVTGPLGEPIKADVLLVGPDHTTAVIDMATASGLLLIPQDRRDPSRTTTYGTGELIRFALSQSGVKTLIIGLGGSATNDCGAGCLQALGFVLQDDSGQEIDSPCLPLDLTKAAKLDDSKVDTFIRDARIIVACDVDNPLTGERGASRVFGPQKGATPEMVEELERCVVHFGKVLDNYSVGLENGVISNRPSSGAAGGLGAALMAAFPNSTVKPGIDIVLDYAEFDDALLYADLVITGEGRLDPQTLGGKAISGVLRRANAAGVPVAIIAGSVDPDTVQLISSGGVSRVISLSELAGSSASAITDAAKYAQEASSIIVGS